MGFADVPGFGAKSRGEWGRAPPRGPREAPAQGNTGACVLARGRCLCKSRKKIPRHGFSAHFVSVWGFDMGIERCLLAPRTTLGPHGPHTPR